MKRLLILLIFLIILLILLFLFWRLHAVYAQTEKLVPIEHVSSIYEEQLDYPAGRGVHFQNRSAKKSICFP